MEATVCDSLVCCECVNGVDGPGAGGKPPDVVGVVGGTVGGEVTGVDVDGTVLPP
jgi:hypothetical protein